MITLAERCGNLHLPIHSFPKSAFAKIFGQPWLCVGAKIKILGAWGETWSKEATSNWKGGKGEGRLKRKMTREKHCLSFQICLFFSETTQLLVNSPVLNCTISSPCLHFPPLYKMYPGCVWEYTGEHFLSRKAWRSSQSCLLVVLLHVQLSSSKVWGLAMLNESGESSWTALQVFFHGCCLHFLDRTKKAIKIWI